MACGPRDTRPGPAERSVDPVDPAVGAGLGAGSVRTGPLDNGAAPEVVAESRRCAVDRGAVGGAPVKGPFIEHRRPAAGGTRVFETAP